MKAIARIICFVSLTALCVACGGGGSPQPARQTTDDTSPVISLIGDNPQIIGVGDPYLELGATAIDNVDGDLTTSIVIDASPVDDSVPGTYLVTYNVRDAAGNAADTVTRTVIYEDRTPPAITLVGDNPQVILLGTPYTELGATAVDNVDGDLTPSIVVDASAVDPSMPGDYSVSYNVSDTAGNAAAAVCRTVTYEDRTPPVITLVGSNPQIILLGNPYIELGATAVDNVDGELTASIVIDASGVVLAAIGDYRVTYDVRDAAGNAAVTVTRTVLVIYVDSTPPVITLLGSDPQIIAVGDPYIEPGATASDNWDDDLTVSIVIDASAVDPSVPGEYSVSYNVSDAAGNAAATVTRTVVYEDRTPPVITLVGDDPQSIAVGGPYIELGATATDNVDGDVTEAIVTDSSAVDATVVGDYEVSYDVSDAAGNAAQTAIRTVTVLGSGKLTDLRLSVSSLDQVFQADLETYTASVSVLVSSITIIATPEENDATIAVNGIESAAGGISSDIALVLGSNIIDLTVTSSDATISETYIIDVDRLSTVAFSQKLTASDAEEDDYFSRYLAFDGNTALISKTGDDVMGTNSGSVYAFTRSAGIWTEHQKLVASDYAPRQIFGRSVALQDDMALIVGDGAIYMFWRAGGVWAEQQKFGPGDGASGNRIALDGNTAVFSAYGDAGNAVYVFEYLDGVWIEKQKLTPTDGVAGFGSALALDGDTLVVGNSRDNIVCYWSGSAYIFHRIDGVWTEHTKLVPSDARGYSSFGNSIAVEGNTIVVGARLDSNYPQPDPSECWLDFVSAEGSAYVYVRNGDAWQEHQKLVASDEYEDGEFGSGVALDGDTIVVSANDWDGASFTVGYVFVHDGDEWVEQHKMIPVDARAVEYVQNPQIAIDDGYVFIGSSTDVSSGFPSGTAMVFGGL